MNARQCGALPGDILRAYCDGQEGGTDLKAVNGNPGAGVFREDG